MDLCIPSGAVHSMMSADARRDVLARAQRGHLRLLYVARSGSHRNRSCACWPTCRWHALSSMKRTVSRSGDTIFVPITGASAAPSPCVVRVDGSRGGRRSPPSPRRRPPTCATTSSGCSASKSRRSSCPGSTARTSGYGSDQCSPTSRSTGCCRGWCAVEHRRLAQMVAFASTGGCLRGKILSSFGDPAAASACASCGNCRPHLPDVDGLAARPRVRDPKEWRDRRHDRWRHRD